MKTLLKEWTEKDWRQLQVNIRDAGMSSMVLDGATIPAAPPKPKAKAVKKKTPSTAATHAQDELLLPGILTNVPPKKEPKKPEPKKPDTAELLAMEAERADILLPFPVRR